MWRCCACRSTCWEAPQCYRSSRYSRERTIRSSRERVIDAYAPPGIYVGAVLLSYYSRARNTHCQDCNYPRLSIYACLFVSDAASDTLRNARYRAQPFPFIKHRQGRYDNFIHWSLHSLDPATHDYALCTLSDWLRIDELDYGPVIAFHKLHIAASTFEQLSSDLTGSYRSLPLIITTIAYHDKYVLTLKYFSDESTVLN